jgi:hypothetical protein
MNSFGSVCKLQLTPPSTAAILAMGIIPTSKGECDVGNKPSQTILMRSRDGTFFEIPKELAATYSLRAADLQAAMDFFENDVEGRQQTTPVGGGGTWAKMSW